jgi:transposase
MTESKVICIYNSPDRFLNYCIRTVRQWFKRFYETGKIHAAKTRGRQHKTTRDQDLDIAYAANENPFRTRLERPLELI